jgi:dihydroorotate dehydrogenase
MLYRLVRPLLFLLPAETAHDLVQRYVRWLGRRPWLRRRVRRKLLPDLPELVCSRFGLTFSHPLGLAAGLDKTGAAAPGFFSMGFSFVECGTFTPRAQAGNPRPRLFRLPGDRALINRMGFNNPGAVAAAASLRKAWRPGPIGANLGKNRDTPEEDATQDYVQALRAVGNAADYFVVNVSSPNTPGLRRLQLPEKLLPLLQELRRSLAETGPRPLLVKISPDLSEDELHAVCDTVMGAGVDGLIAANTTLTRPQTGGRYAEEGGMSGAPLKPLADRCLQLVHQYTGGRLPLVGVGGLSSGTDLLRRIRSGASLLQAYTGFIFGGPAWVGRVVRELAVELRRAGFRTPDEAVGVYTRADSPRSSHTASP